MRRIGLVVVLAVSLRAQLAAVAPTADKVARVGLLLPSRAADWDRSIQAFRQTLGELGWIEGQNLVLDVRYAENKYHRLPALADELVDGRH